MIHRVYDLTACTIEPSTIDLLTAMHATADNLGCTVLGVLPVAFQPHGTTAVLILAESHLVVSTWPEHHTAHVDLFTCRADHDPDEAVTSILAAFGTPTVCSQRITRQIPSTSGCVSGQGH